MIREIRVTPEILDLKARREILVRLVQQARKVTRVFKDRRVKKVKRATLEIPDLKDPKVSRVFKDRRVNKDQKVILVIMVFHLLLL